MHEICPACEWVSTCRESQSCAPLEKLANYRRVMDMPLPVQFAEPIPTAEEAMGFAWKALMWILGAAAFGCAFACGWSVYPLIVVALK